MACFRCVLRGRGGWWAEGENHSRTKPLAGHQPRSFRPRPTSASRVRSARPPWRRRYRWTRHRNQGLLPTLAQGCDGTIPLLSFCFPASSPSSSWCSWSLGGFQHLPCQWYYWHLDCFPSVSASMCFWWPQRHAWTPTLSSFNYCRCFWLLGELPAAPSFPHWATGNNLLLIPPFRLSCRVTALSQGCCFPCRCLLSLPGCE